MLPLLEEWPECPGCGALDLQALHIIPNSKRLAPAPFLALLGCRTCGLVFTAPRPTPEALDAFYDGRRDEGWRRGDPATDIGKMTRKRAAAAAKLAPLGVLSGAPGRAAIDVGCGAGAMLDVLQEAGWDTVGIEPSRIATFAAARHRMIDALPETPTFDLVIVHHVLEHVLAPGRLVRQIAASCRPGACMLVGVPSLEGVAVTGDVRYACSPVHINSFTHTALANVLRVAGWSPSAPDGCPARARIVMYGTRVAAPTAPTPDALDPAIRALRQYGRRLDSGGEFPVCPTAWPDHE